MYFTSTCYAVSTNDRIVPCVPCKKVFRVKEPDHAAAVEFHTHTPGNTASTPPTQAIINTATKTWLQVAPNKTDRAYHYTCRSCVKTFQYRKADAEKALAYHLGEYCTNPDPSLSAPEHLIEEALPTSRSASTRKNKQDYIRSTLLAIINGFDVLAQATGPERATSPASKRPRDTTHDDPPTTPKRAPPPSDTARPCLAPLHGATPGDEDDDMDAYEDADNVDPQVGAQSGAPSPLPADAHPQ